MEVTLRVKEWRIQKDDKTDAPQIVGAYEVISGKISIATESFNGAYSERKIPFSEPLIKEIQAIDKKIRIEVEEMLK